VRKALDLGIKPPKEGDKLVKRIHEKFKIDSFDKNQKKIERWESQIDFLKDEREFLEDQAKEDIFREKKNQEALALQYFFF